MPIMPFDVVVVGGGSAGCVLAARLSDEPDRHVCLLEAGPAWGPGELPADVRSLRKRFDPAHDWGDEAVSGDRRLPYTRGRLLGGGSAVNATMAFRPLPADVDAWGHGWSWADLAPAFDDVERHLPLVRWPRHEWTELQRAFVERCVAAGYGDGVEAIPMNRRGLDRLSAAEAFLHPVWERPNLTVRGDAEVVHVGDGWVGLADGERIEAGEVWVSAGVVGTPRLLWRSGIDHPDLGRHLSDHVSVPLPLRPDLADRGPTLQVVLRYGADLDRMLFPVGGPAPVIYSSPQASDLRGRVTPDGIEWPFAADPAVAEGLAVAREIAGDWAAVEPGDGYIEREHRAFLHGCGTCAIGRVLDGELRVDGHPRIRVGDASAIPTVPRVNPNLTVMALASRIATRGRGS